MEITEIKQQLTIDQVLTHYHLKPNGNNQLRCPWHNDKTPSLQIFPKTNSWTCFSSNCNAGSGDAIEFCVKMEKDKHQGILVAQSLVNPDGSPAPTTNPTPIQELPRIAVLSKVAQESQTSFKRTAKAKDYLQSRSLDPEQTEAGYIGPELGKSWNEALQQSALQLGILKKSARGSLQSKFKYCVVFFMRNAKGQVVGIYGRSVDENTELKHLYLNGKHQGLYPGYPRLRSAADGQADEETTKLILTESIIDAVTLLQQPEITKQYQVLALYGTNGFTPDHEEAIKEWTAVGLSDHGSGREIILFFDGDQAGKAAIEKITTKLQQIRPPKGSGQAGIKITAVPTPEGEDINSLLQGHAVGIAESPDERSDIGKQNILPHLLQKRKAIQVQVETRQHLKKHITLSQASGKLDITQADKLVYSTEKLTATVWGGVDLGQLHKLKINLLVQLNPVLTGASGGNDLRYYQDDVNLYSHSQLQRYIKGASEELEAVSSLIKQSLQQLKKALETYRLEQREKRQKALQPKTYPMTAQEEKAALALLKNKHLVKKTMEAITGTGLVGEQKNGLLLYFLYLTRLFEEPLHAIIFGKSGSGKTYLQTKISECLPEESVRTITSLSENVLYYSPKGFWQHVVLVIEDLDGVYQALLALRELMSKQSITKYTTDKDAKGNNIQKALTVEGPVSVSGATTKEAIYEDNANRSFLLYVDESVSHLEQVMDYQRKARAGMINSEAEGQSKLLLRNAQRLLDKRINVYNPFALQLKLPQAIFKPLRTNEHYLKLIDVIAFYHQKQRTVKTNAQTGERYLEVTLKDIEIANSLVKESLLRKSDELNGELRQFFEYLKDHVRRNHENDPLACRSNSAGRDAIFYAKDIRKERRLHPMKLARYLSGLERRGYIKWTGGSKRTGYEYQVTAWEEYEQLREGMHLLDKILEKLKEGEAAQTKN